MELSEREKRLLQEMETRLLAEDPSLASSLSFHRLRVGVRRVGLNTVFAPAGVVAGVLLMGVGVSRGQVLGTSIALLGYLVLLVSTSVVVNRLRARRARRPAATKEARRAGGTS